MSREQLTAKESEVIAAAVKCLEGKFYEEDGAQVEMFDYNDDYVDFLIRYKDGYEESMAVERYQLTSGKTTEEIVQLIE